MAGAGDQFLRTLYIVFCGALCAQLFKLPGQHFLV